MKEDGQNRIGRGHSSNASGENDLGFNSVKGKSRGYGSRHT